MISSAPPLLMGEGDNIQEENTSRDKLNTKRYAPLVVSRKETASIADLQQINVSMHYKYT